MKNEYLKALGDMLDTVITEYLEDKPTSLCALDFDIERRIQLSLYLKDKITYHERLNYNSILTDIEQLWRRLNNEE